jgi:predicted amidohydrolase YtcJ
MRIILWFLVCMMFLSCGAPKVDLLVYNATIYTVDSTFSIQEAMAVDKGKIIALGKSVDLQKQFDAKDKLDAQGKVILPGLIDAHAHFLGYGQSLQRVNLVGTKSWSEVVERTKEFAKNHDDTWILGRGWDQNDWQDKAFPTNELLNQAFSGQAGLHNTY